MEPAAENLTARRQRTWDEDRAAAEAMRKYMRNHNVSPADDVDISPEEETLARSELEKLTAMTPEEQAKRSAKNARTEKVIDDLDMDDLLTEAEEDLKNGKLGVYGMDAVAAAQVAGEGAKLYLEAAGGPTGQAAASALDSAETLVSGAATQKGVTLAKASAELMPEPYELAAKTIAGDVGTADDIKSTVETANEANKATGLRGTETTLDWLKGKFELFKNNPVSRWLSGAKRVTKSVRIVEEARRDHVANMGDIETNSARIETVRAKTKQTRERLQDQVERHRLGQEMLVNCRQDPSCPSGQSDAPSAQQPSPQPVTRTVLP